MNGQQDKGDSSVLSMQKTRPDTYANGNRDTRFGNETDGHRYVNGTQSSNASSKDGGNLVTVLRDTIKETNRRMVSEFVHIDEAKIDKMTIEAFSDYITRERLRSMPHRGSLWDRVLRWAEFYALQVAAYADNIGEFVPESRKASNQIFVLLRSLLEHGEENAAALDTTFGVFYKIGLSLAFLNSYETKLGLNTHIREDVGRAFHDIHSLVFSVASYYQKTIRSLSSNSTELDFTGLFRENLDRFHDRQRS
jgi:hypothetical protein